MTKHYEVTDAEALKAAYPQFFKAVPDGYKIRKALSLGITLPGVVEVIDSPLPPEPRHEPDTQ
jgi:hypothetical protein